VLKKGIKERVLKRDDHLECVGAVFRRWRLLVGAVGAEGGEAKNETEAKKKKRSRFAVERRSSFSKKEDDKKECAAAVTRGLLLTLRVDARNGGGKG